MQNTIEFTAKFFFQTNEYIKPKFHHLLLGISISFFTLTNISAQRYILEFQDENLINLYEKAEKNYVNGRYEKSTKYYDQLIALEGEKPSLLFNQLTSLIHTDDTLKIEHSFKKLLDNGFLDCAYLSSNGDFSQIKYKVKFRLWQKATNSCYLKEKEYLEKNKVQDVNLRKQLLYMKQQDVISDIKVIHKIRYNAFPNLTYDELKAERSQIYINNFSQLLVFSQQNGWPGLSLVGEDGAEAAWLIAQHGNHLPPAQEHLLSLLKKAVDNNEAKMSHYAHLYDRVCANTGKPQKYGTLRWKNPETTKWELYPVEDSTNLNGLRVQAGLLPVKGF